MKAKEYVTMMREQDSIDMGLSMMLKGLIKDINDMRKKRGGTRDIKANVAILDEIEKKYRAIQRKAPEFWEISEEFKKRTLLDLIEVVSPELWSFYSMLRMKNSINESLNHGRRRR